ncbi:hypothetical protein FXB41_27390 [Bradyrhizobium canariense]|uniref:hypothetical protein n=1 Tax=Bradyrhizobium canariense TaxID=255045 RepID=UPI001CA491AC|nr:hypothetical protein [Bradyrhizobium canariense]MBW5438350.1 hypothetical protein [Bradyrhizobium canariense]
MFDSAEDWSTTAGYWSAIIGEMRDAGTLAAVNGHSVERLVMAQVVGDRATAAVAREGAIRRIKGTVRKSPAWIVARRIRTVLQP